MTTSRNSQLLRILGTIRDLSASRTGVAIQDLRDRYGVTRRTIERDLAAIEAAGYVVESLPTPEPGKIRKRILAGSVGLHLQVTVEELAAARAGVAALHREAPPSIVAALRMLVERLEESQSMAVAVDADALAEAQGFVLQPGSVPTADPNMIEVLRTAILRCERVRVSYRKGGEEPARDYLAEPYGLLYGAKGYLVWRGVDDHNWRKFALPYLSRLALTGETFVRDPKFVLKDFITDAFGVYREEPVKIVLHVLPKGMTRLRQHSFHPTQTVEPNSDGGATVRFTASGLTEICWHLFTWGDLARPVSPPALIQEYQAQITLALAAIHSQDRGFPSNGF